MTARTLFQNARLIDPAAGRDGGGWLLVEGEAIADVGRGAPPELEGATVRDCDGLILAPGLIDLRARTGEPGSEHKETLASASAAAAAGGVTTMVVTPETDPVIDDPALIDFLLRRARDTARVRVLPSAALTKGLAGEAMTEIGLLQEAGAVMFANGPRPVADARVLRRALVYARNFDALCAVRPEDASLAQGGVAHEGAFAARLGLAGVPALAEETQLARDALIAEDAGARLMFDLISSRRGLAALAAAKHRDAPVFASASAAHLKLNELDVGDYRTYARLAPPLREEADRRALVEAVGSGLIDVVVSAHDPQPPEDKRLPFAEAEPGAVGLETLLPALLTLAAEGELDLRAGLRAVTSAPAALLGLAQGRLSVGAPADLTLIDAGAPWVCRRDLLRSRSKNTPFDKRRLQGRAVMTMVAGRVVFERADALAEAGA